MTAPWRLLCSLAAPTPTADASLADRLATLHTGDAATYAIDRDAARTQKPDLRREPIDRWTNPTRVGGQTVDLFVWTDRGRPGVVASTCSHPRGNERVLVPAAAAEPPSAGDAARRRRGRPREIDRDEAESDTLFRDRARTQRLELVRDPVYVGTNPLRSGGQDGMGFVWTWRGRAEALGTFFSYPATGPRALSHEFHSLSFATLVVDRAGGSPWSPEPVRMERRAPGPQGPLPRLHRARNSAGRRRSGRQGNREQTMTTDTVTRRPNTGLATGAAVALLIALAPDAVRSEDATPGSTAPGVRRALIVCGLPGDEEHRKLYAGVVEKLYKAMTGRYGFKGEEILIRFGTEVRSDDGAALKASRGLSDAAGLAADVAELKQRLAPGDTLWVVVVGHGHLNGRRAYLNVPGPDPDERALGKLFEGIKARDEVFFVTTSVSGFFLKPLAAPGRVVITATEPDLEVNETLFPRALADVLESPPEDIDRDRDGNISVFELYLAVVANTMQRYADDENLPTEHAKLDDDGDGRGSEVQSSYLPEELGGVPPKDPPPPVPARGDGRRAAEVRVGPVPATPASPAAAKP